MPASFVKKLGKLISKYKRRNRKPLTSHRRDVQLVRKVHGKRLPRLRQILHINRILSVEERRMLLLSLLVLIASSLWFFVGLARTYRTEVPGSGGVYAEAVVGSVQVINPLFSQLNDVDRDVSSLVYSGLMKFDKDRQLQADLAEAYEVSEDKKTYTFTLRDGITWHDGEVFDAEDVVFTIETIQDSEVGSPLRVGFQGVAVEALNEKMVQFTLEEPFQSFLGSLTVGMLPEHVWNTIAPDTVRIAPRNLKPIGTGPFMFKDLAKDQAGFINKVELARFEAYYDSVPHIKEVSFVFFAEYQGPDGAIQALREGKVQGVHFVPFDLREKVARKHIELYTLQLPQYSALFFNEANKAFLKQDAVRSALATGLDKQRILHETLANEGEVLHGPLLRGFVGFDSTFDPTPYSVSSANEALDKLYTRIDAEAYRTELREVLLKERTPEETESTTSTDTGDLEGEGENVDSEENATIVEEVENLLTERLTETQLFYRKDKEGDILELDLVTADTAEYRKVAHIISGAWEELGIKTRITFIAPDAIAREVLRERNYDVLLFGLVLGSDPDQYPFWHSSQIEYPGLNLSKYVNRAVDDVLEKIRETEDGDTLVTLYQEFQKLLVADTPAIFLYAPTYTYVLSDDIKGFDIQHISHPTDRFSDIEHWYIKTKHTWNFKKGD